jgi:catechol 2,3-dioxygenase-like lactoylglutathione lyase family enzyme
VTAIAIDPQANLDFYTGVLGLRLVKLTVNFDDPGVYHFYFADYGGHPGAILTFFPFTMAARGRPGAGMVDVVTFAASAKALESWMLRLTEHGVEFDGPRPRFTDTVIAFRDPDGLKLEIRARDDRGGDDALCGFDGVTLCVEAPERTAKLLTETFGYRQAGEESRRTRYLAAGEADAAGKTIDILCEPDATRRRPGGGTVHHVAFRARDEAELAAWRERIAALGFDVTSVRDRQYFHSIYLREPGGILFEIATDSPGFAVDESVDRLGTSLKLPPWLEDQRETIERRLPPVRLPRAAP